MLSRRCNDFNGVCFSQDEFQVISELSDTLYDSVAFYKHWAEGETNNTFGYVGGERREDSLRCCREMSGRSMLLGYILRLIAAPSTSCDRFVARFT